MSATRRPLSRLGALLPTPVQRAIYRARVRLSPGRIVEDDWAQRPGDDADRYWDAVGQPHRQVLLSHLRSLGDVGSFLELGCHGGPNLRLVAEAFPAARLAGIEINGSVAARARELLKAAGLGHVEVMDGSMVELMPRLGDESYDVIFSCFALAYLSTSQLLDVLGHSLRVARTALVLVEPQVLDGERPGLMRDTTGWRHDYVRALESLAVPASAIQTYEVPGEPAVLNGCLVANLT